MIDAQWLDAWPEPTQSPPQEENSDWGGSHFTRILQYRHDKSENIIFMDGSARKVGLKELWSFKWHRLYDTKERWTLAGGVQPGDWPDWMESFKDY